MFNDTITVYNKYKGDDGLEKWQRSVLVGVFWNALRGAVMRRTGLSSTDSIQVIIPFIAKTERKYKPPKAWSALEDKTGFWTLQSGDTVVKGEIKTEITKSIKELNNLDDAMIITSVDIKDFGDSMAHFDVSGR